jgi:hypothetical protein
MTENQDKTPIAEAQHDAAQSGEAKVEASVTDKPSEQLSEDQLNAVAGGSWFHLKGRNYPPGGSPPP